MSFIITGFEGVASLGFGFTGVDGVISRPAAGWFDDSGVEGFTSAGAPPSVDGTGVIFVGVELFEGSGAG